MRSGSLPRRPYMVTAEFPSTMNKSSLIIDFQNDIKNLEDACDELSLLDDDIKIPYLIGEVFVNQNLEKTQVI